METLQQSVNLSFVFLLEVNGGESIGKGFLHE